METETMTLGEFVADVLAEIQGGVRCAQEETRGLAGAIAPARAKVMFPNGKESAGFASKFATPVSFDVAVTALKGQDSQWGVAVAMPFFGIGRESEKSGQRETVSRVQFSIPVVLPPERTKGINASDDDSDGSR